MDDYTVHALKIIGAPRHITIQNKKVDPAILMSPALGESILFWLASSISLRMHGETLLHNEVIVDKTRISGTRLQAGPREIKNRADGTPGVGLASSVLILSEAADQILSPARTNPKFDYAPLVTSFRDEVLRSYNDGVVVSPSDFNLNTILHQKVFKPSRSHGQKNTPKWNL